jgi:hypothetical protein
MFAALFMAEFFYDNEETLFHSDHGFDGGKKFTKAIWHSIHHGADKAWAGIEAEKSMRPTLFDQEEAFR